MTSYDEINLFLDRDEAIANFFLAGIAIGPQGAFQLITSLPTKFIRVLELRSNNIGVTGAPHLAKAIAKHPTLEYLGLARNFLTSSGTSEILNTLRSPESRIQCLDLQWNDIADGAANLLGDVLKTNTALKSVNLDRNRIRAEGTTAIAEGLKVNKTLQNLSIGWNRVRVGIDAIGEALSVNTSLLTLNLCENEILAENVCKFAEGCAKNATLQSLDLSGNTVGESGLCALLRIMSTTQQQGFRIKELNVTASKITPSDRLAELLEGVYAKNTFMMCLCLGENPLKDPTITRYVNGCMNSVSLRVLSIPSTQATSASLANLNKVVVGCPYLHTLNFEGIDLGVPGASLVSLAVAAVGSSVTSLNVSRTRLGPSGARALAQGLSQQRRLVHLYASDNEFTTDGCIELCNSLLCYTSMETFDLSNNQANGILLMYLRKVIAVHQGLSHITVQGNECCGTLGCGVYARHHADKYEPETDITTENALTQPLRDKVGSMRATLVLSESHDSIPSVEPSPSKDVSPNISISNASPLRHSESNVSVFSNQMYGRKWNNFNRSTAVQEILTPDVVKQNRSHALLFTTPATATNSIEFSMKKVKEPNQQHNLTKSQIVEVFTRLDRDGSGFLDLEEVRKLVETMEHYGVKYSKRQIDDMLMKYGVLKDGKVSFEEFEVVMYQLAKR